MNDLKIVEKISDEDFNIDMRYKKMNFKNAIENCYVVPEVLEKLLKVKEKLQKMGLNIKIWDAWRPMDLQKELFETYFDKVVKEFNLENLSIEEQENILIKFVSKPVENIKNPPLHTTAAAIDVTLTDSFGNDLNMGTDFDEFSSKSYTNYYDEKDKKIAKNRKILLDTMKEYGFRNLETEWWHYDLNIDKYIGIFSEEDLVISKKE